MHLAGNVSNLLRIEGVPVVLRRKSGGNFDIDSGKLEGQAYTDYTLVARLSAATLKHAETFQEVVAGDEVATFSVIDLALWGAGDLEMGDYVVPSADPVARRVVEVHKRRHSHMALLRRAA